MLTLQNYANLPQSKAKKSNSFDDNVVIKMIRTNSFQQFVGNFEEIILSSNHDHPNILPCLGFNYSNQLPEEWITYIIYPKMPISLDQWLTKRQQEQKFCSLDELINHAYTLLSVHEYLEEKNIAHTNIKPENIFFDEEGILKVSEIGSKALYIAATKEGTSISNYVAPELIFKSERNTNDLLKGDIWSLGVIILELALAQRIDNKFIENSEQLIPQKLKVVQNIYQCDELITLLEHMICKNPENRWSFSKCKQFFDENLCNSVRVVLPTIANPRKCLELIRENELLKNSLQQQQQQFYSDRQDHLQMNHQQNDQNRLLLSDHSHLKKTPINAQSNNSNSKFEGYYKVYENFNVIYDESGHFEVQVRNSKFNVTKEVVKNVHNLMQKFGKSKSFILKASEYDLSLQQIQSISFMISELKSIDQIELYLTQSNLDDKKLLEICLNLSAINGIKKCVLGLGGTLITSISLNKVIVWLYNQIKSIQDLEIYLWGTEVNDDCMQEFSQNCLSKMVMLNNLTISLNNTTVGDEGVEAILMKGISSLRYLRQLELGLKETKITNNALGIIFSSSISKLEFLESLELGLGQTEIGDIALLGLSQALISTLQLKKLCLYLLKTKITNNSINEISYSIQQLKQLQTLIISLRDTDINDNCLEEFNNSLKGKALKHFELFLRGTQVHESSLSALSHSQASLNKFSLEACQTAIKDKFLQKISQEALCSFKSIRILELQFWETPISDQGFESITKNIFEFKGLSELILGMGDTKISNSSIQELNHTISKFKTMHRYDLDFQNTNITNCSLSGILSSAAYLKTLKLSFGGTKVDDYSFRDFCMIGLSKLKHLERFELYLWGTKINDQSIKEFATQILQPLCYLKLPIMERQSTKTFLKRMTLSFSGTSITDLSLKELYLRCSDTLVQLERCEIEAISTHITKDGIKHLRNLKNFKRFKIKLEEE